MKNPTTDQIRMLRGSLQSSRGINKTSAMKNCAALIYTTSRTWARYEAGDVHMHPGLFELATRKVNELITLSSDGGTTNEGD